jgi:phosphoribosylaminoimidazolecarboxamide formyltransferase / IMP cyclohydrolase
MIRRALISVSDKTGLIDFAQALLAQDIEIVSTGGTSKALRAAGIAARDVSDITNFPEIMDGRVKTLHPAVHGGLLAIAENENHIQAMNKNGIDFIDLLVVNLYPFEKTMISGAHAAEIIENIDIGGPAMIRAAAKNFERVTVVVDPSDYKTVLSEIKSNGRSTSLATRRSLAGKAYARTAAYDTAIARWFDETTGQPALSYFTIGGPHVHTLRYGENPHQTAAAYKSQDPRRGILDAKQLQGKELSYNNINDADAALQAIIEFPETEGAACVIVKHANPCGVAIAASLSEAYSKAYACDATSAFGGIVALNRTLNAATAIEISKIFTEVIFAPAIDDDALAILQSRKNLRLLLLNPFPRPDMPHITVKSIVGGLLVQSGDTLTPQQERLTCVTERKPDHDELRDLLFAARVAKHVKSNAIVFAKDSATTGIGAGQMSRIDSTRIAVRKGKDAAGSGTSRVNGSVLASDAFFPFPDGIEAAADAGATAIIQPGGSLKDADVIAAANRLGLAMVMTGERHFRH